MRSFIKTYEVGAADGDCFDFCRPSSLLNFMQDAATKHSEHMGISRDVLINKYQTIWILARTLINLERPVRSLEKIELETWHRGFHGPLWYRDFEFKIDGELIGTATQVWVTADAATHKLKRPDAFEEINTVSAAPERSLGVVPGKLKAPEDMTFSDEHKVKYSDLDVNCHLNNAKYADLLCNAIAMDQKSPCYFSKLQINYNNESLPGEKILLSHNNVPSFVVGSTGGGDNKFIAEFTLNFA